ncbi:hypothetical protein [Paracidovorax anthurii]|uniref:hypothetical protein n=1 Tax=Paracidovorax anthurii TaxID=78229 RepID=UPI0039F090AF
MSLIESGRFTRTDGSQGASGVAEVSGSLLLAGNNFYREFPDDPEPSAAAAGCGICARR